MYVPHLPHAITGLIIDPAIKNIADTLGIPVDDMSAEEHNRIVDILRHVFHEGAMYGNATVIAREDTLLEDMDYDDNEVYTLSRRDFTPTRLNDFTEWVKKSETAYNTLVNSRNDTFTAIDETDGLYEQVSEKLYNALRHDYETEEPPF